MNHVQGQLLFKSLVPSACFSLGGLGRDDNFAQFLIMGRIVGDAVRECKYVGRCVPAQVSGVEARDFGVVHDGQAYACQRMFLRGEDFFDKSSHLLFVYSERAVQIIYLNPPRSPLLRPWDASTGRLWSCHHVCPAVNCCWLSGTLSDCGRFM